MKIDKTVFPDVIKIDLRELDERQFKGTCDLCRYFFFRSTATGQCEHETVSISKTVKNTNSCYRCSHFELGLNNKYQNHAQLREALAKKLQSLQIGRGYGILRAIGADPLDYHYDDYTDPNIMIFSKHEIKG